MSSADKQISELFKAIMAQCKRERRSKTDLKVRDLAQRLGKTENYLSSIENGREFPSLKTFLRYLILNSFDTEPLTRLTISPDAKPRSTVEKQKSELVERIYSLNDQQVSFLVEQAKIAEVFAPKKKRTN